MTELDPSTRAGSSRDLLDEESVGNYLISRGLTSSMPESAVRLAGGVSNVVLAAEFDDGSFVVKQSMAKLAVADEWRAPTDRVITEAETARILARITPSNVPIIYDQDVDNHAITLQLASPGWADWKSFLMAGDVQPAIARTLGDILATWHKETFFVADLGERLENPVAFELLRIEPYYRTVARRAPELADKLNALIAQMTSRQMCLVHGDFSPKNVLVAPDIALGRDAEDPQTVPAWVIDFEVAHRGDPAFDIAFMCSHFLLKSLALRNSSNVLDNCLRDFTTVYSNNIMTDESSEKTAKSLAPLHPDTAYIGQHIGALLLARVKGKSPVEYLDLDAKQAAWRMGLGLLDSPLGAIDELFTRRDESRS